MVALPHANQRATRRRARITACRLTVDDRISVSGGYEYEPTWLGGRDHVEGTVHAWITGHNSQPACVVLLDQPLTAEGDVRGKRQMRTGSFLILELRYAGQIWESSGTVHVELCHTEPENKTWSDRAVGAWVESHASYEFHS
jgi:hypothetical protein